MSTSGYSSDDDSKKTTADRVFKEPEYPVVIVDQKYCSNFPMTLTFEKNREVEDKFKITDDDGKVLFKAGKKKDARRVMLDDADETIINYITKSISMHRRRQAFRGDSADQRIFSVKTSRGLKSQTYDVFMTSNLTESIFNYRVNDSYRDGSSVIYAADKTTLLAKLNIDVNNEKPEEKKFTVELSPNVDKAFISALLILREEVLHDEE